MHENVNPGAEEKQTYFFSPHETAKWQRAVLVLGAIVPLLLVTKQSAGSEEDAAARNVPFRSPTLSHLKPKA